MVIAAPRPAGWAVADAKHPNLLQNVVGLNVSEPLPRGADYYPQPDLMYFGNEDLDNDGNTDYPLTDAYLDYSDQTFPKTAKDAPLDVSRNRIPNANGEPVLGTVEDYCSALLQRLADPTKPYNAITNPYRTVDWMPIDLTVFSGEDRESRISGAGGYARRSRQRNGHIKRVGSNTPVAASALYSYETDFQTPNASIAAANIDGDYFRFDAGTGTEHLQSSFSFLNTAQPNVNPGFVGFAATVGSLGSPAADDVTGNDRNLPQTAYAVHPWLNRPFASAMEVLMVPASSQGRLFEEFSFNPTGDPNVFCDGTDDDDPTLVNAPFRHLLNFFHSSGTPSKGLEFARVFDFVNTLPRFRGEVEYISPTRLYGTNTQPTFIPTELTSLLPNPFNFNYDSHRQGTINLNTLSKFPVWAGLMQGHMASNQELNSRTSGPFSFDTFRRTRRGYAITPPPAPNQPDPRVKKVTGNSPYNYDPDHLDAAFPTEFGGVFRSATHANKAIQLRTAAGLTGSLNKLRRESVNAGLLRDTADLTATTPSQRSLFVRPTNVTIPQSPALNRLRNPFMRHQTLMRMPNLVSNNSQMYLVRMTVGFFEVDAATQSLGREYNAEVGRSQRYQGTFVIDRSIPVGFSPGQDLNTRDVVIFESYAQ